MTNQIEEIYVDDKKKDLPKETVDSNVYWK
jgi:hypothetical protein